MGIWNAADETGKRIKLEQHLAKKKDEADQKAQEDEQKEAQQHEEDKQQGMI
jgi:hypothetical protein